MPQRTQEWFLRRAGKITASGVANVLARSAPKVEWCRIGDDGEILESFGGGKTGQTKAERAVAKHGGTAAERETAPGRPLQARADYLTQIVVENLTGEPQDGHTPFAQTQWGVDVEPYARSAYEARRGVLLVDPDDDPEAEFVSHPELEFVGCSPDGQVREGGRVVGGAEIKCPYRSTIHLDTLRNGMPMEHYPQLQTAMWVHDTQWWDFVSYDPRFPEPMRLYVERVERDDEYLQRLDHECRAFWGEVQAILKGLRHQFLQQEAV